MSNVRFEVERYIGGWRWVLVHKNGKNLAYSENYSRKRDVTRAIKSLKKADLATADVRRPLPTH